MDSNAKMIATSPLEASAQLRPIARFEFVGNMHGSLDVVPPVRIGDVHHWLAVRLNVSTPDYALTFVSNVFVKALRKNFEVLSRYRSRLMGALRTAILIPIRALWIAFVSKPDFAHRADAKQSFGCVNRLVSLDMAVRTKQLKPFRMSFDFLQTSTACIRPKVLFSRVNMMELQGSLASGIATELAFAAKLHLHFLPFFDVLFHS